MSDTYQSGDDEVDLLRLLETIWNGKWKIILIVSFSLISVYGFNLLKPNTSFIATTEIKPITSVEFDKYRLFNASLQIIKKKEQEKEEILNIFEVSENSLLNLYLEKIEEGSLLEEGIIKFNLIDRDNFDDEGMYKSSVIKFASEIKILKPNTDGKINNENSPNRIITAEYNDKQKWLQLVSFVNNQSNKKVRNTLTKRFETIMNVQNQKRNFAITDIETKINNVKEDYKIITKNRLALLNEQASIARKLNIDVNTINAETFDAQNMTLTNVLNRDTPLYLRGYIAIEEEIRLIKNRKDKTAFTDNLHSLEKEKRKLEQDKTLKRAKRLFLKTPLKGNDFKAARLKAETTDFKSNNNIILRYFLTICFGGMLGIAYVLISNAFSNRKRNSANP